MKIAKRSHKISKRIGWVKMLANYELIQSGFYTVVKLDPHQQIRPKYLEDNSFYDLSGYKGDKSDEANEK
jgi:hypothetical protein